MAPSTEVFDTAMDQFEKMVKCATEESPSGSSDDPLEAAEEFDGSDPHVDLTEFPYEGSWFTILCFSRFALLFK